MALPLLKRQEPWSFDFINQGKADNKLSAVSASYGGGANGLEFRDGIWQTPNGSYGRQVNLPGLPPGRIFEPALTNKVLYSADVNDASWSVTNATKATATSMIEGETACALTASASNARAFKNVGTFTGNSETASVLIEQNNAETVDFYMYDLTAVATVAQIQLTYSTGAVTLEAGTAAHYGAIPLGNGPSGNPAYILWMNYTGTVTNTRRPMVYVDTTSPHDDISIIHNVQIIEDDYIGTPIVSGASETTLTAETLEFTLPSWFNSSELTMVLQFSVFGKIMGAATVPLLVYDTATSTETCQILTFGTSVLAKQTDPPASDQQGTLVDDPALVQNEIIAGSFNGSDVIVGSGGSSNAAGAAAGMGAGLNKASIGSAAAGGYQFGGIIHSAQFIPRAYSAAQLQALTS